MCIYHINEAMARLTTVNALIQYIKGVNSTDLNNLLQPETMALFAWIKYLQRADNSTKMYKHKGCEARSSLVRVYWNDFLRSLFSCVVFWGYLCFFQSKYFLSVHCMFDECQRSSAPVIIMASSNGKIFRVTSYLCGEFTGHRWIPRTIPVTRSFDVFYLRPNKRSKQWRSWWFETPSRSL